MQPLPLVSFLLILVTVEQGRERVRGVGGGGERGWGGRGEGRQRGRELMQSAPQRLVGQNPADAIFSQLCRGYS